MPNRALGFVLSLKTNTKKELRAMLNLVLLIVSTAARLWQRFALTRFTLASLTAMVGMVVWQLPAAYAQSANPVEGINRVGNRVQPIGATIVYWLIAVLIIFGVVRLFAHVLTYKRNVGKDPEAYQTWLTNTKEGAIVLGVTFLILPAVGVIADMTGMLDLYEFVTRRPT